MPSAGEVLTLSARAHVAAILHNEPRARLDEPGGVHQMRVATRRLRSLLQTFAPMFRAEEVAHLRTELKWLAGELGVARDAEVMREEIAAAIREEEAAADAAASIEERMDDAHRTAHEGLRATLDSARYHRLVHDLHRFVDDPPLSARAGERARRVLPRRAGKALSRVRTAVTHAREAETPGERDLALHEARKAAKRARYAGEALTDAFGEPAALFASRMEDVQEELGEFQDSVVMRARIRKLAAAETSPRAAFLYGCLHAREERRGELALGRFDGAWKVATKKSVRAWTR
ncbi:CHAD domain-containing protein [Microbacterium sp. ET2]|uniref:CHAD domain-containing protein n=1 Tax=Microbacterium albipurpureum TaxID=3050384 RepID=UPI00259CB8F6|nr:CHAD domain-containing protein [Microbacterium sp. ET2 (Ac-2212)]WJL94886.1 CHAD domain-containing protein [Microbacterium sp. ET2 (Ac-2212)]